MIVFWSITIHAIPCQVRIEEKIMNMWVPMFKDQPSYNARNASRKALQQTVQEDVADDAVVE